MKIRDTSEISIFTGREFDYKIETFYRIACCDQTITFIYIYSQLIVLDICTYILQLYFQILLLTIINISALITTVALIGN